MFTKQIILVAIFATVVSSRELYIFNKLDQDIVVSVTGQEDVTIEPGNKIIANVEENFGGRVTAVYADCKDVNCKSIQTLAEFSLGEKDLYDVSLIDGFNLPVKITPRNSLFCPEAACTFEDLIKKCPSEKQILVDGKVVACKNDENLFEVCSSEAIVSSTDFSNTFACDDKPNYYIIFEFVA